LEKLGFTRYSKPWWVGAINSYETYQEIEEIGVQNISVYAMQQAIQQATTSNHVELMEKVTTLVMTPHRVLREECEKADDVNDSRIEALVSESKLVDWTLPETVSKVNVVWPVIYAKVNSPLDVHQTYPFDSPHVIS
jgi:hypothetical protein